MLSAASSSGSRTAGARGGPALFEDEDALGSGRARPAPCEASSGDGQGRLVVARRKGVPLSVPGM